MTAEAWYTMKFLLVNHIILVFRKCTRIHQNLLNPQFALLGFSLLSINGMWLFWKSVQFCTKLGGCSIWRYFTSFQNMLNNCSLVNGVPVCSGAARVIFSFGHFPFFRLGIVAWLAKNTRDCDFACCLMLPIYIWVAIIKLYSSRILKNCKCWPPTRLIMQPKCHVKNSWSVFQLPNRYKQEIQAGFCYYEN